MDEYKWKECKIAKILGVTGISCSNCPLTSKCPYDLFDDCIENILNTIADVFKGDVSE